MYNYQIMDTLNYELLDAIQLVQHNSANDLLEHLLKSKLSSKELKDLQLSSQIDLVTGLNYQRKYISIDSSISVNRFITMYAKIVFEEIYRNACISESEGKLDSAIEFLSYDGTLVSIDECMFTRNHLKPIVWLWKMDISDEQWKYVVDTIKKRTDEAFKMAKSLSRSFWKKAFVRQPAIKPVHNECEPDVILARISRALKKMDVKLPSQSVIHRLTCVGYKEFMKELE